MSYCLSNADEETTLEELALAHFIVTLTRRDVKDDVPDFRLDMAVRVLQSAFAHDRCTEDDAFSIIEYHLRRNQAAHVWPTAQRVAGKRARS